jgi:DNA replication protein DnaC
MCWIEMTSWGTKLIGGTGTGKTHLAIALGRNAVRRGKRVRCYGVVELVNQLELEKAAGKAGQLANRLVKFGR